MGVYMKKNLTLSISLFLLFFSVWGQADTSNLKHKTNNANTPIVYYTKDVSPQGLIKVYKALNQKLVGKTGIKVSFGSDSEQYLDPKLMTELAKETDGTFIETCGFTPPRDRPKGNYQMAEKHGFTSVAPVDIIDSEKDIDMPVTNGLRLKFTRTGSHFDNYDTLIAVHRFKAHYIPIYGGNIKNISLCLGSLSGKAIIHSGGTNLISYSSRNQDTTAQCFADAAKAAMEYKKDRWAFINVMDSFEPTDNCKGTKNLGNIGIVASLDPVAVDQAAVDFEYGDAVDENLRKEWEDFHSVNLILNYCEKDGVGSRNYRLVSLD
jgi:uncharacterized protein